MDFAPPRQSWFRILFLWSAPAKQSLRFLFPFLRQSQFSSRLKNDIGFAARRKRLWKQDREGTEVGGREAVKKVIIGICIGIESVTKHWIEREEAGVGE